jgi:hypothetical protein
MNIEAVILYTATDARFLKPCIENLSTCGIKSHVVYYSHMWNGTPEDTDVVKSSINYFKGNKLVNFYNIEWESGKSPWYWEGLGRYLATQEVSDASEYIIYVDSDEIVDVELFSNWIEGGDYKNYDTLRLSNYWYWRLPIYQATQKEDSIVLCKASLAKALPFYEGGREGYYNPISKKIGMVGKDAPMFHHYSWVRTKEEMIKKVTNWGHAFDKNNWISLIEEEFSRPFNGTDFVHGYSYSTVNNKYNIEL